MSQSIGSSATTKKYFDTVVIVKEHTDSIVLKGLWLKDNVINWCKNNNLTYVEHSWGS